MPPPRRLDNGYRDCSEADVERVKLVAGARSLDFSLEDIAEILALRDRREAPCRVVLDLLQHKAGEISRCIASLQRLEAELRQLHQLGLSSNIIWRVSPVFAAFIRHPTSYAGRK